MMRTSIALLALVSLLAGCEAAKKPVGADELTIVVQADRRELEAQEKALKAREEALKNEAGRLDKRIKELANNRVAADLEHRQRLDEELTRARNAQDELSRRVMLLQTQKAAMEAQRTVLAQQPQPQNGSNVAVREQMVASREARLSARETSLAAREADLALREKSLALREAALGGQKLPVSMEKGADGKATSAAYREADKPAENNVLRDVPTRADIEGRHKRLLAEMDSRGILISDLAPEDQPINAAVYSARKKGDFARAADLLVDLQRAIERLRVDQRFVEQKMVRLQGQRSNARLGDPQKNEVEQLLRDVTASYSDGHYEKANRGLNRIAAILDASRASG